MKTKHKFYQCKKCKSYFSGKGPNVPWCWKNHGWDGQNWCPGSLVKTKLPDMSTLESFRDVISKLYLPPDEPIIWS
jgi:hypothetical protein